MATQSPFFGKRDRDAESLTSRPAPLMGSSTNLTGTPVNPSTLTTQAANAVASVAKEGGSKLTVGPNIKLKGVEITDCDTLVVEGLLRRELAAADATLNQVRHEGLVHFDFRLPEPIAAAFIARLDDAAQGRVAWL